MKKLVLLALAVSVLSCTEKKTAEKTTKNHALLAVNDSKKNVAFTELYGSWTGIISDKTDAPATDADKKMAFRINRFSKDAFYGDYSINGKQRYMSGKVVDLGNQVSLRFDETGRNKQKTKYELVFEDGKITGVSKPATPSETLHELVITLERKPFVYDAKASTDSTEFVDFDHQKKEKKSKTKYIRPSYPVTTAAVYGLNGSSQAFTEASLKNLKKLDLQLLRNTIYARHGYIFNEERWLWYFNHFDWYLPVSKNVEAELTPLEKSNIALLKKFEKYAEEYYEYFGR